MPLPITYPPPLTPITSLTVSLNPSLSLNPFHSHFLHPTVAALNLPLPICPLLTQRQAASATHYSAFEYRTPRSLLQWSFALLVLSLIFTTAPSSILSQIVSNGKQHLSPSNNLQSLEPVRVLFILIIHCWGHQHPKDHLVEQISISGMSWTLCLDLASKSLGLMSKSFHILRL